MTRLLLRLPLYEISVLFCLFFLVTEVQLIDNAVSVSSVAVVQSLSRVQLFATPWAAPHQASLSLTNSQSLLKPMSIESVMPSSHLILCHPLLLLPSIFPSIRVFSKESALCIRWPKYSSFSVSPFNEYSVLIDWLDLLAVQGTLQSLLQHHSSKASILRCSAFFMVQLLHPYMTTEKNIVSGIQHSSSVTCIINIIYIYFSDSFPHSLL